MTMTPIRISHIKPGQVAASDVKDRSGRTLLAAGTELTEKTIKIIKSWGVVEIDVVGEITESEFGSEITEIDPERLHLIELDLSQRFRFLNRSHPFINELFEICLRREALKQEASGDH